MSGKRAMNVTATARLKQDYMRLKSDPVPYITAEPLPSNLLEWHYIVRGPEGSPYEGGIYHGKLLFPHEFPFKPPGIIMMTPNGRFQCNKRLCLSISDFHPDTWNPAWSVSTILTGLLSFMLEFTPTLGSIETSTNTKRSLAGQSAEFNLKDPIFRDLFPDVAKEIRLNLEKRLSEVDAVTTNDDLSTERLAAGGEAADGQEAQAAAEPVAIELQAGFQLGGGVTSVFIVIIFAIFALVVKHVLHSLVDG